MSETAGQSSMPSYEALLAENAELRLCIRALEGELAEQKRETGTLRGVQWQLFEERRKNSKFRQERTGSINNRQRWKTIAQLMRTLTPGTISRNGVQKWMIANPPEILCYQEKPGGEWRADDESFYVRVEKATGLNREEFVRPVADG